MHNCGWATGPLEGVVDTCCSWGTMVGTQVALMDFVVWETVTGDGSCAVKDTAISLKISRPPAKLPLKLEMAGQDRSGTSFNLMS